MARVPHKSNPTPEELALLVKKMKAPTQAPLMKKGLQNFSIAELLRARKAIRKPSQAVAAKGSLAVSFAQVDLVKLSKKIKAPTQAPVMK